MPPCRRGGLPAKATEGVFGVSRPGRRRAPGVCQATPCRRRSCIAARVCRAGGALRPPGELAGRRQQTRHFKPGIRHRSLRAVGGQRHFPQSEATSKTAICLLTHVIFFGTKIARLCRRLRSRIPAAPRTHLRRRNRQQRCRLLHCVPQKGRVPPRSLEPRRRRTERGEPKWGSDWRWSSIPT